MSRSKGTTNHSGKSYTVEEYNLIHFLVITGLYFHEIARVLERPESGIECAWRRLCHNATDYSDKRLYKLKPLTTRPLTHFSGPVKEYIKIQWTKVKVRPSIEELSKRLGISKKSLLSFIEKNESYWIKPQRDKLL